MKKLTKQKKGKKEVKRKIMPDIEQKIKHEAKKTYNLRPRPQMSYIFITNLGEEEPDNIAIEMELVLHE